ncbi:MAG: energy transducer TonB [Armatimonadota bacterium]
MNNNKKNLYRAWLPLSVLLHLLLLAVLYTVKIPLPRAEAFEIITIVQVPLAPLNAATIPVKPIPPPDPPKVKPPPVPPQKERNKTVTNPNPKLEKNSKPDGQVRKPYIGLPAGPGTGKTTAPPATMTVPGGRNPGAPAGVEGGVGTQGTELGPEGGGGSIEAAALPGGPNPIYPKVAEADGLEGTVVLTVRVGSDGRVDSIDVSNGSGYPVLDDAAKRAARRWSFQPAKQNGIAVNGTVRMRVRFTKGHEPRLTPL